MSKQKMKENREAAELLVLSGPDNTMRDWLLRQLAKRLRDTGTLPIHVEMYRSQILETEIPEPDHRLEPKVIPPTQEELAKLNSKWTRE